MRPRELDKMFELEDTYWWFVARRGLVLTLLGRRLAASPERERVILDVGCGTGATLEGLSRFGRVVGMDSSRYALQCCRRRGRHDLVQARGEALPIADASADAITALDLLEHIPDDAAAVREFSRVLRPGGVLIVTVPACPFLWSEHDEALGHRRRYRRRELARALEQAGFEIALCSYVMGSILPAAIVVRLWERWLRRAPARRESGYVVVPRALNELLAGITGAGSRLLPWLRMPFGLSIVALARRPDPGLPTPARGQAPR